MSDNELLALIATNQDSILKFLKTWFVVWLVLTVWRLQRK